MTVSFNPVADRCSKRNLSVMRVALLIFLSGHRGSFALRSLGKEALVDMSVPHV